LTAVIDSPLPPSYSALVVDPDHVDRVFVHSSLAAAGFSVTTTNTYEEANVALVSAPPLVLVTAIRLGAFNGIHLALRGRAERAGMALIVTSSIPDAVLQRDAEQIGATFVQTPVTSQELMAAIYRTMSRTPNADGMMEPVRPPFERRRAERRAGAEAVAVVTERRIAERRRDVTSPVLRVTAVV
jgi:DNA-binding NtrC family response regulator